MPYIKDGKRTADHWIKVQDGEPLPAGKPCIVTAARLLASEDPELSEFGGPLGVIWPNHEAVVSLAPHLEQLSLVALVFPTFRDGRAYTQARQLREQHGFKGELRATGDVLRDQFLFMVRAGFDAFEVKKEADADHFSQAAAEISVLYQPSTDGKPTAFRLRSRSQG